MDSTTKKLTVIVPLYNQEKYIEQCVKSIMYQTYKDIDILIIDDGSTDESYNICNRLAGNDNRIRIVKQENKGLSGARRTGIDYAETDYVTFVDADDFILQDAYIFAENSMQKNIDMIFFEISRYSDQNNINRERHILDDGYYDRQRIEQQVYPRLIWNFSRNTPGIECSLCVRIVKRELLKQIYELLDNDGLYYGEDIAVTYPLYTKIVDMQVIGQSFYMHRQRNGTVASYLKKDSFLDDAYRLYKYLLKYFNMYVGKAELIKQIEYFYMYSVNLRKMKYQDYHFERQFLFPFDKIEKGKSIILYGAGMVGKSYYTQMTQLNYCKDILWVDKNAAMIEDDRVQEITCIHNTVYDVILIAIENKKICRQVADELAGLGIERNKIVF